MVWTGTKQKVGAFWQDGLAPTSYTSKNFTTLYKENFLK